MFAVLLASCPSQLRSSPVGTPSKGRRCQSRWSRSRPSGRPRGSHCRPSATTSMRNWGSRLTGGTISAIELGHRRASTQMLAAIAEALGIHPPTDVDTAYELVSDALGWWRDGPPALRLSGVRRKRPAHLCGLHRQSLWPAEVPRAELVVGIPGAPGGQQGVCRQVEWPCCENAAIRAEKPRWNLFGRGSRENWTAAEYVDYVTASTNLSEPMTPSRLKRLEKLGRHYRFRFGHDIPRADSRSSDRLIKRSPPPG